MDTIGALLDALDARDGIASGHSRRVARYAGVMGEALEFPPESQRSLELAALLHDVGKILISEQILGKPGKLTDQETYLIRQHPEMGEKIVGQVEFDAINELELLVPEETTSRLAITVLGALAVLASRRRRIEDQ